MQIQPYKTKLCQANAYWMAILSNLAYTQKPNDQRPDTDTIIKKLKAKDSDFESVIGFSNQSSQGMFVEHANYLAMVFRGTDMQAGLLEAARDWVDNLNAFSEEVLFGDFHRGFWHATNDIWQGMTEAYEKARNKKKRPLFITGHSLGGAMATIAAAKFIHEDKPFISVYTFGQPRVMQRKTARIFNSEAGNRFFRFHNNNDIVTRVPARLMGYGHVGQCIYIDEDGLIHDDSGFWFRFLDAADGFIDDIGVAGSDALKDHDMSEYARCIENCKDFPNG